MILHDGHANLRVHPDPQQPQTLICPLCDQRMIAELLFAHAKHHRVGAYGLEQAEVAVEIVFKVQPKEPR